MTASTVADLPAPLVPAEVDLRDFVYLPLDVLRLRDSDLACTVDAEIFRCAVLSWCVAWHQTPAASLPDDDAVLARLLGFGRDVKGWRRVRAAGGLRGWVLCSDGRLYHPVVAEKARDAWQAKLAQRARTEAARRAREAARQKQSQPLSQGLSQTNQSTVTEAVTESKVREGKGREYSVPKGTGSAAAQPPPGRPPPTQTDTPTDRDAVFAVGLPLLTAAGVSDRNARSFLALQAKTHGEAAVRDALQRCAVERPIQPVPWIAAALGNGGPKPSRAEALYARNAEVARRAEARAAAQEDS